MKKALLLLLTLQLLINSMLGYAHMAVDIHDDHETAHVHAGGHLPSDIQLGEERNDHENETHAHLCFVLLDNPGQLKDKPLTSNPISLDSTFSSLTQAPPVPPPTA